MATEYPKNLYRWTESGEKVSKLFKTEADVEPGWVSHDDLGEFGAKPAKAAKPAPAPSAEDVSAKIADAEARAAAAEAEIEKLDVETEDKPAPRKRKAAAE